MLPNVKFPSKKLFVLFHTRYQKIRKSSNIHESLLSISIAQRRKQQKEKKKSPDEDKKKKNLRKLGRQALLGLNRPYFILFLPSLHHGIHGE